jgi:putative SOS response-associated peptidase YedK
MALILDEARQQLAASQSAQGPDALVEGAGAARGGCGLKVGFANINAKAEGIESKPAFREAFQRRRCLDKKTSTGKQPYAIALADRGLMALAGLWENCGHRRASGCAVSPSSPPFRTSYARSCTIGCR